ncbi:MAG: tRNA pseudouridine(55) synthase TruB [Bacteroidia bacterium]|jgi:tRNA pseudouridine55 synthase
MRYNAETGMLLLIDKPLSWTSFDVVNKIRYAFLKNLHRFVPVEEGQKRRIKVGHAGTLDPLATGLLIVCVGKETKQIDQYMATEKEYTGSIYLGATTPSYDRETETDRQFDMSGITSDQIHKTAAQFVGEQQQIPPVYSAIKQDGKKMYEMARAGKEVEMQARSIHIFEFEITQIEMPLVYFRVVCSKGTYIRSLTYDFGKALKGGAYLHSLCRTRSGAFLLKDAISVDACVEWINGEEIDKD